MPMYTVTDKLPHGDFLGGKFVRPGDEVFLTLAEAENELLRGTVYLTGGDPPAPSPIASDRLPAGGLVGQVLSKDSEVAGDASWKHPDAVLAPRRGSVALFAGVGAVFAFPVVISQEDYDALDPEEIDDNTIYFIPEEE